MSNKVQFYKLSYRTNGGSTADVYERGRSKMLKTFGEMITDKRLVAVTVSKADRSNVPEYIAKELEMLARS